MTLLAHTARVRCHLVGSFFHTDDRDAPLCATLHRVGGRLLHALVERCRFVPPDERCEEEPDRTCEEDLFDSWTCILPTLGATYGGEVGKEKW